MKIGFGVRESRRGSTHEHLDQRSIKTGWMWKRGGGRVSNAWKSRWFMLTNDRNLVYLAGEKESKPKGSIDLRNFKIEPYQDPQKSNCFQLSPKTESKDPKDKTRIYYISCASKEDRESWFEVINQSCQGIAAKDRKVVQIEQRLKGNSFAIPETELKFIDGAVLGKGGSGIVRKALWLGSVEVAVKALNNLPEFIEDEQSTNFYKEIEVLSQLKHPSIVSMYGYCKKEHLLCLVTEFVPGGSLDSVIHDHTITYNPLAIATSLCAGMMFLHNKRIVHRDLKPGNVLVENLAEAKLKICDFGLSKMINATETMSSTTTVWNGSPGYAAPETALGKFSEKADVFSFGMVLWALYARKSVFPDCDYGWQIIKRIEEGERPIVPDNCELKSLIHRCWHHDPAIRPDFKQIYSELQFANNPLTRSRASTPLSPMAPQRFRGKTVEDVIPRLIASFGNEKSMPWTSFANACAQHIGGSKSGAEKIRYFTYDETIGEVPKSKCEEFFRWFSPLAIPDSYASFAIVELKKSTELESAPFTWYDILRITSPPYFFGFLSESQVMDMLENKPGGTFLLRFSNSYKGTFTLSVKSSLERGVHHVRVTTIKQNIADPIFVLNNKQYASLEEMIDLHKTQPLEALLDGELTSILLQAGCDRTTDSVPREEQTQKIDII